MSKQKIREWLDKNGYIVQKDDDLIPDMIEQYTKDQSEWVSPSLIKLENPSLLLTESGQIVTGWLRQLDDDKYFCFGNEHASWDFEWNFDLGAVIGWLPLPPTQEA
jgi:hypothetical protein